MPYTYPDRDDRITSRLIETEYDGTYWGHSEEEVLRLAHEEASKKRVINYLDLGCGQGRLLPVFADIAERIIAAEPDKVRFEDAEKTAVKLANERNSNIVMVNGDISKVDKTIRYDMILSSHVLQHIPVYMSRELMSSMSGILISGGLLVLTTTYAPGEDEFYIESIRDGERAVEKTDRAGFEAAYGKEGILPVRIIGEKSFMDLAERAGLQVLSVLPYHYKDHHSVSEDIEKRTAGIKTGARDVMYIMRKKQLTIDANVNFHFSFSIFDEETGLRTDDEQELRKAIADHYLKEVFMDSAEGEQEQIFKDIRTGQGFLHGGGLPFNCFRVLLKDFDLKFRGFEVFDSAVLVTVFPESDTVQMCIGLSFKNLLPDELIYLRHCMGNGAKLTNSDGRELSVYEIFEEGCKCLGRKITDIEQSYLVEVKRFGEIEDIDRIIAEYPDLLYGAISGDEGWRNVPRAVIEERLTDTWGSRNFIRYIAFGTSAVFFNLHDSKEAAEYRESRRGFDARFYGDMNPYFLMDNNLAGINHGILFSMEMVMVIKTLCNRILRKQSEFHGRKSVHLKQDIRKTKAYRSELITTLNKIENLGISEIGELENVMIRAQKIEPIIDKIKYLLELLESEISLLYDNSTNAMVTALTIIGLCLTALGLVLNYALS